MAGLGQLDSLAYELMGSLISEFGGTGKIEIKTKTSSGGFSGDPTYTTTTLDNIAITPPSPFVNDTDDTSSLKSGLVETYVSVQDCTTEPLAQNSFLTIYKTDFLTGTKTSQRLKITNCNPVMSGNSVAGYQLICEGSH